MQAGQLCTRHATGVTMMLQSSCLLQGPKSTPRVWTTTLHCMMQPAMGTTRSVFAGFEIVPLLVFSAVGVPPGITWQPSPSTANPTISVSDCVLLPSWCHSVLASRSLKCSYPLWFRNKADTLGKLNNLSKVQALIPSLDIWPWAWVHLAKHRLNMIFFGSGDLGAYQVFSGLKGMHSAVDSPSFVGSVTLLSLWVFVLPCCRLVYQPSLRLGNLNFLLLWRCWIKTPNSDSSYQSILFLSRWWSCCYIMEEILISLIGEERHHWK